MTDGLKMLHEVHQSRNQQLFAEMPLVPPPLITDMEALLGRLCLNDCKLVLGTLGTSSVSGAATGYRSLFVKEVEEDGATVVHSAFALSDCVLEVPFMPTDVGHNGRFTGMDYVRMQLPLKTFGPLWRTLRKVSPASTFRKAKLTPGGYLSVWVNWGVDGFPGAVVSSRRTLPPTLTPADRTAEAPAAEQDDVAAASDTLAGLTLGAATADGGASPASDSTDDGGDPPPSPPPPAEWWATADTVEQTADLWPALAPLAGRHVRVDAALSLSRRCVNDVVGQGHSVDCTECELSVQLHMVRLPAR